MFKVIRPPVLIQLTSFYTQDLLLSHTQPSYPGGPHPSVVPTHNILQFFKVTTFYILSNSQHPSVDPTHNILQFFKLTTSFSWSNSQHPSVFQTHKILQLIQLTTSFSFSNSQHPSVVPTHNSLYQFHIASFHYYMNILCLSRDPSRVPYSLGSSTVSSHSTPGLVMSPYFVFVLSCRCRNYDRG